MKKVYLVSILLLFFLNGCATNPGSPGAVACEKGLSVAYRELDFAKAQGFSGTWEYTKAAGLLSAAKIQFEFGKYPNCINKVKRARIFIKRSQKSKKSNKK